MASSGLGIFRRNKWTHFSFFVVWENIQEDEIRELESLFREIYRRDEPASSLNKQKGSKTIRRIHKEPTAWKTLS